MIVVSNLNLKTNNDIIHFLKQNSKRLNYLSNIINYYPNTHRQYYYYYLKYKQTLILRDKVIHKKNLHWPNLI